MTASRRSRWIPALLALGVGVVLVLLGPHVAGRIEENRLLEELQSEDEATRRHAGARLSELGSRRATPFLAREIVSSMADYERDWVNDPRYISMDWVADDLSQHWAARAIREIGYISTDDLESLLNASLFEDPQKSEIVGGDPLRAALDLFTHRLAKELDASDRWNIALKRCPMDRQHQARAVSE